MPLPKKMPDPYQAPSTDPDPDYTDTSPAPAVVVEHLRHPRPWVKFCSLAGYITSGFLVLIGILTLRGMFGNFSLPTIILLGSFYLVLALLFTIPSLWLSRYEKSITRLLVSNHIEDLEMATSHQRAFWRQMAIMILLILLIYLVTIAFSAIVLLSQKT